MILLFVQPAFAGVFEDMQSWIGPDAWTVVSKVAIGLGIFILGWFAAKLISWMVFKLLCKTNLDDKLSQKLGFKVLSEDGRDPQRVERIISRVVYWILMLLVLVAVLDYAELPQVAGPIQGLIGVVVGALPFIGKAIIILVVAWVVATILKKLVTKGLDAVGVDNRFAELSDPSDVEAQVRAAKRPFSITAGRVIFWLVMIIGLAGAFDALQITALSAPLQNMLDSVVSWVPRLAVAALIILIGYVIARVVKLIVSNLLESVGFDGFVERIHFSRLFGSSSPSRIIGVIAFWFILIQAIVAGVERVGLKTLSEPLTNMMDRFWSLLPDLVVGGLLLAVAYFVAKVVRSFVEGLLNNLGFNDLMERLGFSRAAAGRVGQPSVVVGTIVQVAIILIALAQVLNNLGLHTWAGYVDTFLTYALHNVFVAALILLAGFVISNWVHGVMTSREQETDASRWMATLARYTILVFAFTMALYQLDIAQEIVIISFGMLFGAICLAFGLAFGLGGKDTAGKIVKERYESTKRDLSRR